MAYIHSWLEFKKPSSDHVANEGQVGTLNLILGADTDIDKMTQVVRLDSAGMTLHFMMTSRHSLSRH